MSNEGLLLPYAMGAFKKSYALSASVSELAVLLRNFSEVMPKMKLIVDGFDEYSNTEQRELLYYLRHLDSSASTVFFSRETPDLERGSLETTVLVQISTEQTYQDVESVIKRDLQTIVGDALAIGNLLYSQLCQLILQRAAGLHIYARLILDALSTRTTIAEMLTEIEEFPSKLKSFYKRTTTRLDALPLSQCRRIRRLFQFTLCGSRPMSTQALEEALSVECNMTILASHDRIVKIELLIRLCHPLLRIDESNNNVVVAHESIREFMLRTKSTSTKLGNENLTSSLSVEQSHAHIASTCLTYLMLENSELMPSDTNDLTDLATKFPFLTYASMHWTYHLAQCGSSPWITDLLELVAAFFEFR